jgi:hypothetical protein
MHGPCEIFMLIAGLDILLHGTPGTCKRALCGGCLELGWIVYMQAREEELKSLGTGLVKHES